MSSPTEDVVRQRAKQGRTCIIYSGNVYDVTDFVSKHPGGVDVFKEHSGQDVTEAMHSRETHKHSKHAFTILDKYCVGKVQKTSNNGDADLFSMEDKYFYNRQEGYTDPVDWKKPVLPQIPKLGEQYFEWAHQPTDLPLRLFHSDFVEYFSKCSWWMVPMYWVPAMLAMIYTAYTGLSEHPDVWLPWMAGGIEINVSRMPYLFILGALSWTLLEYVIHRWVFHLKPPTQYPIILQLHFLLHGQHHKAPMEKGRLVFPLVPANILAVIMYSLVRLVCPRLMTLSVISGTVLGYMMYDLIHYYLHHGSPSLTYFKNLKRYHVKHHFEQQHKGFGISSKLWDYPFNTLITE
ncbi:fatty acid 2-hydroxylase-like [Haliotis cracherodii]|uniref:fatty acid 2-hydroxylase-like n=1 Tax=Haliotis cracherodii TaxID=6455 RepID=UPI0039EB56FC